MPLTGTTDVRVQSISPAGWEALRHGPGTARRLGRFERAVNLVVGERVVALVVPTLLNGPFHVVVDALPPGDLPARVRIRWESPRQVRVGPWRLRIADPPPLWDPRLGLGRIPSRSLRQLRALVRAASPTTPSPFAPLLRGEAIPQMTALRRALASGDPDQIPAAVARLAGRGPGLTPSGDDVLAGVMMGLWSGSTPGAAPPAALCDRIYRAAAPRTTRLSGAYLRAASLGHADERWHRLLSALAGGDPTAIERAARRVLAFGASSGLDMLAGFLWVSQRDPRGGRPPR